MSQARHPDDNYISPNLVYMVAIRKFSSEVILHPKPDAYFVSLLHACEFIEQNMNVHC
jgi:hypothetical protein